MKTWSWILLGVLSLGVERSGAQSLETNRTVLPPGLETQPGNTYFPLFSSAADLQQFFRSSTFPSAGPVQITSVAFRVGRGLGSFSAVIPTVRIHLTTSTRTPEQMTSNWNLNKGSDDAIVYDHFSVSLFSQANQQVNPFDLRFDLDTPFVYDPRLGSLAMMLDIVPASSIGTQTLDVSDSAALGFYVKGILAPISRGLVTEFSWVAIPEPEIASLLIGPALFAFARWLRQEKRGVE
jgi:hypothetical protein